MAEENAVPYVHITASSHARCSYSSSFILILADRCSRGRRLSRVSSYNNLFVHGHGAETARRMCQKFIMYSRPFVPDNGSSNNSLVLDNCSTKQSSTGHQSNITKQLNQKQIRILRILFSPVTCCLRVVYSFKNGYPKIHMSCFVVMNIVLFDLLCVWIWQQTWRRRNCNGS